jgi:hypothetical protein
MQLSVVAAVIGFDSFSGMSDEEMQQYLVDNSVSKAYQLSR